LRKTAVNIRGGPSRGNKKKTSRPNGQETSVGPSNLDCWVKTVKQQDTRESSGTEHKG